MNYNQHLTYSHTWPVTYLTGFQKLSGLGTPPQPGDEIAALGENGQLVGKQVFTGGATAITIHGDDYYTPNVVENLAEGESVTFEVWNANKNSTKQYKFKNWEQGDEYFANKKVSIVGFNEPIEEEVKAIFEFDVYPNPGQGDFYIEISSNKAIQANIKVYDSIGKLVHNTEISLKEGEQRHRLSLTDLSNGNYSLIISTTDFEKQKSIMISK
ncbi:MAG: T9SS type A sorting domain-containing protein [candidate division Zixibacteria bacterium]|nr:T9SS type A sorting domain-containing protein [candidate division Zixibacteria bacterium]